MNILRHNILCFFLLIFFSFPQAVFGGRAITLPFEEKFDSGDTWTSDLRWTANGATGTHLSSGGWSGGCAKFTPPNTGVNGTYSGLGQFNGIGGTRINIRFLVYLGSTYVSTQANSGGGLINKFIIAEGSDGRLGIMGLNGVTSPAYESLGIMGNDEVYWYNNNSWGYPNGTVLFTVSPTVYVDEWFCVEYEIDIANDTSKAYIWTQDGLFNGELLSIACTNTGTVSYIDIIGGYYNRIHTGQDANTYMLIDELKISNTYIGPPAGFGETTRTAAGVTYSGAEFH